jgi:hypothetical protein
METARSNEAVAVLSPGSAYASYSDLVLDLPQVDQKYKFSPIFFLMVQNRQ